MSPLVYTGNCVTSCYTGNCVTSLLVHMENCVTSGIYRKLSPPVYTENCVTSGIYKKLSHLLYIQKIVSPVVYFLCEHLSSASSRDEPKALHGTTVALFSASQKTYCALIIGHCDRVSSHVPL